MLKIDSLKNRLIVLHKSICIEEKESEITLEVESFKIRKRCFNTFLILNNTVQIIAMVLVSPVKLFYCTFF